jgi:hypothetical protein
MMPPMQNRPTRPVLASLVLAAAVLALAACSGEVSVGGETTVDSSSLEQQLADQLAPKAGVKPDDVSVSCPDDQEVAKGAKFSCTLTAPNGDEVPVDVTLKDDDGTYDAVVPKDAG